MIIKLYDILAPLSRYNSDLFAENFILISKANKEKSVPFDSLSEGDSLLLPKLLTMTSAVLNVQLAYYFTIFTEKCL